MRAYVINIMVVLIIFPVIFQTDISVIMLSTGGQGAYIIAIQTLYKNSKHTAGRLNTKNKQV